MQDLVEVGFIKKTHGYKGDVRIVIYDDFWIKDEIDAIFLLLNSERIPYFISEMTQVMDNEFIIHLEDMESKEVAQKFKGTKLFLPKNQVEQANNVNDDAHDLIGYSVSDINNGNIGKVVAIYDLPQQEMLAVKYGSKEILVPLRMELIENLNPDKKQITFNLPDGFLEI